MRGCLTLPINSPHGWPAMGTPNHNIPEIFKGFRVIPTPAERFRRYTVRGNTTFRKSPSEGKQSAGVGMRERQTERSRKPFETEFIQHKLLATGGPRRAK
jgi:hypothetical protein